MRYLLLIYGGVSSPEKMTEQQIAEEMKPWMDYTAELQNSSKMLGGEALMPTNTATTVRAKAGGGALTTDGPFAETKEALAGTT